MCGFLGQLSFEPTKRIADTAALQRVLSHRGPDGAGVFCDDHVLLVHNRLAIIDLSTDAAQPMVSPSTGNVIVFNGEIYNYRELRQKYSSLPWQTHSDTETLLLLYEHLGLGMLAELNGIFAFAIYDKKKRSIMLCRDRVGVKPLYYFLKEGCLYFASEIKGILAQGVKPELDHRALRDYLEYGLLYDGDGSMFRGVTIVPSGHVVQFQVGKSGLTCEPYWDVTYEPKGLGDQADFEKVLSVVQDAVRLNLVSDVEIGLSLSSGLDSTLLYFLLKECGAGQLRAFTYGFEEEEYDEVRHVKQNPYLKGIKLSPVYLTRDRMLTELKEAVRYFEGPLGGLGTLASYHMMKAVRQAGIKVMLAGEGADEVFGGYKYYYAALFSDLSHDEAELTRQLSGFNQRHGSRLVRGSAEYAAFLKTAVDTAVYAPDGTALAGVYASSRLQELSGPPLDDRIRLKFPQSLLHSVMYNDLRKKKLPKLLCFQDRASMASGVEVRVPYLDHRLIGQMYGLPAKSKIRDGETKYMAHRILREHFKADLTRQVKHYVATPQREWLKGELSGQVSSILKDGLLLQSGMVNAERFLKDYDAYCHGTELGNSFFVWKMINLEFLFREFFNGGH